MNNLKELMKWYETLREESLDTINLYYDNAVFFKDPFNEINGINHVKKIFKEMFLKLEDPRFVFLETIEQGKSAFLTWDFIFKIKGKQFSIHGSSHLKFNDENKIIYHRDYWDVGEELFLKIPFVKSIYGVFRKKLASH